MVELGALYRLYVSVCLCVCLYSDCKITKWIKLRMLETPPSETALLNTLILLTVEISRKTYGRRQGCRDTDKPDEEVSDREGHNVGVLDRA